MADGAWVVEKRMPEEDVWVVHKDGYPSRVQAEVVCEVLAEVYYNTEWRVTDSSAVA